MGSKKVKEEKVLLGYLSFIPSAFAATSVPFTIAMSEGVNVTGTPRIAVDVGGVTRYATKTIQILVLTDLPAESAKVSGSVLQPLADLQKLPQHKA